MRITKFSENARLKTLNVVIQLTNEEFLDFDINSFDPEQFVMEIKNTFKPEAIIELVYDYFDLNLTLQEKMQDAKSIGRVARMVRIRGLVMFFLRRYTKLSLSKVASIYGLDHSTVVHHVNKISNSLEKHNSIFKKEVQEINSMILAQLTPIE